MDILILLLQFCFILRAARAQGCSTSSVLDYKGRYFAAKRINSTECFSVMTTPTIYACRHKCNVLACIALSFSLDNLTMNCQLFDRTRIQDLLVDDARSVVITTLPVECGLNSAVDGNWSEWMNVGNCSTACGTGIIEQRRNCSNPAPACNGHECQDNITTRVVPCEGSCEPPWFGVTIKSAKVTFTEPSEIIVNNAKKSITGAGIAVMAVNMTSRNQMSYQRFSGGMLGNARVHIDDIPQGQMVLVSIYNGNGASSLSGSNYIPLGAETQRIQPYGCLCLIGCKLCGPGFPYREDTDGEGGLCECSLHEMLIVAANWKRFHVVSVGKREGTPAFSTDALYTVDDVTKTMSSIGMHVIPIDPHTGETIPPVEVYHLHSDGNLYSEMVAFINGLSPWRIVLLGMLDTAENRPSTLSSQSATSTAYGLLGATQALPEERDCYCLIGCKDCGPTFPYVQQVSLTPDDDVCTCTFEGFLML